MILGSFVTKFLSSKAITIILMIACVVAGAYITYVLNENSSLKDEVEKYKIAEQAYTQEILRLNSQIKRISKAEAVVRDKLETNDRIIKELESDDKEVMSTPLPKPLVDRMCELGQLTTGCDSVR